MDEINNSLVQLKKETRSKPYWICRRIEGAFPTKLRELIYEREKYQTLLKEEKDPIKLVQYNARHLQMPDTASLLWKRLTFQIIGYLK